MGVSLAAVNFDEMFFKHAKSVPIVINDIAEASEEDKAAFNRMIYTKYSSDLMSTLPSCECGETVGEYNLGVSCSVCHTPVQSPLEQDLESLVWMRAPQGVAKLINPIIWTMLKEKFTRSGFEIIRWICDTTYKPQVKTPAIMEEVQALGIPRGYNNFVENFDTIMDTLFNMKSFRVRKGPPNAQEGIRGFVTRVVEAGKEVARRVLDKVAPGRARPTEVIDPLYQLLREQRNCVFSQYLPLPNKALLVVEETTVGTYVDPIVVGAVNAIRMMVSIDSRLSNYSVRTKENRTIKCIAELAEFYDGLARSTLAKKEGVFRKHVFGTRSHFSFRAVISSITDAHDYDELHIPWGIGVSVLRIHLMSKLLRRNFTPSQAVAFLNEHAQKYHPLLDELFQLLIAECPYKGLPVVFQRNPSLERGSAQAMFVTKIKTDVEVPTVSLSILSVTGFNADFDGDQLNGTLSLDLMTAEELKALAPHKSVFDLNNPRAVSRNLSMPKPVVATIANWLHHPHAEENDLEKEAKMAAIPDA